MPIDYELLKLCIEQNFDPLKKRLSIEKEVADNIAHRDDGRCRICGFKLNRITIHHIKPKGPSNEENLITVCTFCHDYIHAMHSRFVKGFRFYRPGKYDRML
jgi:5-methylcytosine-specific restriction endonuclease McrA